MRWAEIALNYNGLLALCLAMPKHYRQVMRHPLTGTEGYLFQTGGWVALTMSFAASVTANGWSFGPVEWVGTLAVSGLTLVFMLPYAPWIAVILGVAALLATPIVLLL
jgi:hypothetical protein